MTTEEKEEQPLTKETIAYIEDAVIAKHGSQLRPGEWLSIDVKQDKTHCHTTFYIETQDAAERLELEAVVMQADNESVKPELTVGDRFDFSIDFLDGQLDLFFENDRFERFHDDWRKYQFEAIVVRFRGAMRRPNLEQLADQWLASGGDPEQE